MHRNIHPVAIFSDQHCAFKQYLRLTKNELDNHKGVPELASCKWAQKILHKVVTIERQFPNQKVEVTL